MTIASEITRIQTNIADAYTACSNKGATMPASRVSDNLATCIASIPTGGYSGLQVITIIYPYNTFADELDTFTFGGTTYTASDFISAEDMNSVNFYYIATPITANTATSWSLTLKQGSGVIVDVSSGTVTTNKNYFQYVNFNPGI